VTLLSAIGSDAEGAELRNALRSRGVETGALLNHNGRRTLVKRRIIGESQMMLRFDQGTTENLDGETEERLLDRLAALYPRWDAVIVSDYGYGVLTPRVISRLAELQAAHPRPLVIDAKRLPLYREVGVSAVKPNYQEALKLIDGGEEAEDGERARFILAHREEILEKTGAEIAAVTLDADGALIFERGKPPHRTYAEPHAHSYATGAGDTFVSGLALALAAGASTPTAGELASAAASVVVKQNGTSVCTAAALRGFLSSCEKHVESLELLKARVELYRTEGRSVVFTNGCFDILHRGHITYLNRARELGDVLIVGVNSDASVTRLKGPQRPINNLEDRIGVLAALSCIDHLIAFEEDTPKRVIRAVEPDIFVKGGDYTRETLPEAPLVERLGGRVEILPYLEDVSTTSLIERIRTAYEEPVRAGGRLG
jgi:D-beta-D-heptose 7-phosphate kinase/D-beta-D-heptose 1-phosphate adenosyltransferase